MLARGCRSGARVMMLRLDVNSGPACARNAGMSVARKLGAQLVAFLDADCLPEVGPPPAARFRARDKERAEDSLQVNLFLSKILGPR